MARADGFACGLFMSLSIPLFVVFSVSFILKCLIDYYLRDEFPRSCFVSLLSYLTFKSCIYDGSNAVRSTVALPHVGTEVCR